MGWSRIACKRTLLLTTHLSGPSAVQQRPALPPFICKLSSEAAPTATGPEVPHLECRRCGDLLARRARGSNSHMGRHRCAPPLRDSRS